MPRADAIPRQLGKKPEPFRAIRARAAGLAALLSAISLCLGDVIARSFPFGWRTRSVNDLGNQFIPYHAHLWDVLHGKADGNLFVNWQSGYGSSFLPDYGTYLTSPFALLVGVFPRDQIDLAVYVISVLKIATAGAAMAWLLRTVRTGPWWMAGALGASYALCGWTLAGAVYNPMWLDGLIALPLLCLVGEWTLAGRRMVAGPLLVALVWVANFYTAYMATIGAALILIARLLFDRPPLAAGARPQPPAHPGPAPTDGPHPARATADGEAATEGGAADDPPATPAPSPTEGPTTPRTEPAATSAPQPTVPKLLLQLWRPLVALLIGVGLAAPLVSVVYAGTGEAYPGSDTEFEPERWMDVFARLLPGSYGFNSPALYVDTVALLLALSLPFNTAVPRRVRLGWSGLTVAVLLSFQWKPTHLAWHAFTTPNGSQFRQTFVLCALLVVSAWLSVSRGRPSWRALAGGGAVLAALCCTARNSALLHWSLPITLAGVVAVAAAYLLFSAAETYRRPLLGVLAALVLIGMQVGQSTATMAVSDRKRLAHMDDYAPWGDRQREQRAAIEAADGWPAYRTEPGRNQTTGNDPMLLGGQGVAYYSSLTADVLSRTMTALGGGSTSRGRSVQSLDNPVTDVIFSVGARLRSPLDPHQRWNPRHPGPVRTVRQPVPPLVTVRPPGATPRYGKSAFRNQELLLGARVYTVPSRFTLSIGGNTDLSRTRDGSYRLPARHRAADPTGELTTTCPAGSSVYLWAPRYWGTATLRGGNLEPADFRGDYPVNRTAAIQSLGRVPADGKVQIELAAARGGSVPLGAVGCLDRVKLRTAAERLTSTGGTEIRVDGDSIRATVDRGNRGTAVFAMPRIEGWQCSAGNGPRRPADSYLGLVAVQLSADATSVSCSFTPPGLNRGLAVGAGSLLALVSLGAWRGWRTRRAAGPAPGHPQAAQASHD
ncbi:YfhO family protein [Streptomyces sp. 796.1]|uniref:YfhO family protein n=1 Tax=Streptomyces sp. 796.1 TaxID=3163029 RepID=UPI0039C91834